MFFFIVPDLFIIMLLGKYFDCSIYVELIFFLFIRGYSFQLVSC